MSGRTKRYLRKNVPLWLVMVLGFGIVNLAGYAFVIELADACATYTATHK